MGSLALVEVVLAPRDGATEEEAGVDFDFCHGDALVLSHTSIFTCIIGCDTLSKNSNDKHILCAFVACHD